MAKPIFVISFPYEADLDAIHTAYQQMETKLGEDYHILTYRSPDNQGISFQMFNAINATDSEIEDIITTAKKEIAQLFTELQISKELLKKQ